MSRVRIAGVVVAAAVFAALLIWLMRESAAAPDAAAAPISAAIVETDRPPTQAQSAVPTAEPPRSSSLPSVESVEQRFRDAADLLSFVESNLSAAKAGDGASAYWISRANQRCDTEYQVYFRRNGRIRTLDEALQINAGNPFLPIDETRKLHAQCERLRESEFMGLQREIEWLTLAANSGYPLAQMELARFLVVDNRNTGPRDGANWQRAQQLALLALQSKDPAVLVGMEELVTYLRPSGPSRAAYDWLVAACQRGLDCSPQSRLVAEYCRADRDCQPYEDFEAVLRREFPEEYDDFEGRAREINQLIDQDRFDELGFWIPAPK